MESPTNTIYPDVRHPYYIVAPRYLRTSAGVRALHLLCHSLNKRGQTAYMLLFPSIPFMGDEVAPDLLTPILTPQIVRSHFERGLTPITIIPEMMPGNAFDAPCVVRYVLNFPGLLGGDKDYAPDELCFSYSKTLAAATRSPDNVLFVPVTDTRIFKPALQQPVRKGSCYFADKYKTAHNGKLLDITKDSVEITRDQSDSQTPYELAALFQCSEVFYTYENTALALEAVLCGCPAVFLPNPHLTEMIATKELGSEGYAWGADPAEVDRARATVAAGAANYLRCYAIFWNDLDRFITLTQKHVERKNYTKPVRLPNLWDSLLFGFKRRGIVGSLRKLARLIHATT